MKENVIAVDPTLAEVDFIRAELRTGLTLTKIALHPGRRRKSSITTASARKAYDTVMRFVPKVSLSPAEIKEVKAKLDQLRSELKLLGETV
jgi:hypothetical protein